MRLLVAVALAAATIGLAAASPSPAGPPAALTQTAALPSSAAPAFRARMEALWRGVVLDSAQAALPAFLPQAAYRRLKAVANPDADWRYRLLHGFELDLHAAHALLGADAAQARLAGVSVPSQWAWIAPGRCYNRVGYWHAPGSRLRYVVDGRLRSFGIYSLISWRGEWYVVHLGVWNRPGAVVDPADGPGRFGPPGGC